MGSEPCSIKNCRQQSILSHRPLNAHLCDKHWEDLCEGKLDVKQIIGEK